MKLHNMSDDELLLFKRFDSIYRNNGLDPETEKDVSMKDTLDIPQASYMIPRVLSQFVQEGVEPLLIGTSLLQRLEYNPGMQTVFPALDVLSAREVGDGMALPIFNINIGGAQTYGVSVSRHGLALRVDQKFVQQSTYPWLAWWLKLAGQALARHKEQLIFSFITELGVSLYNNDPESRKPAAPLQPVKGVSTGRDLMGKLNGSVTCDDIFDGFAQILMQGFVADTLLVHPLTWLMFLKDPVMRDIAIAAGGGSFFANWTGGPNGAAAKANPFYNQGGLGQGQGQAPTPTTAQGLPQTQTTAPQFPKYFGMNFNIMVSPFMKYDAVNRTADMLMFDSKNLGALVVDEDPHANSWTEPLYNINNIGIEERFGFGILNEGQAIGTFKNIAVRPNEFYPIAKPYINLSEANADYQNLSDLTIFGENPVSVL